MEVFQHHSGRWLFYCPKVKTKSKAAATAAKKKPSTKGNAVPQPQPVKIRRSTLDSIGFEPGERIIEIPSRRIDRIGAKFVRYGLVTDPDQWWLKPVRFICNGSLHEFEVTGCNGNFRVRIYQEKSAFAKWLEDRPADHPERVCEITLSIPQAELEDAFKYSQRRGIGSFEDFLNAALRERRDQDSFAK